MASVLNMNDDRRLIDNVRRTVKGVGDTVLDLHVWRPRLGHAGAVLAVSFRHNPGRHPHARRGDLADLFEAGLAERCQLATMHCGAATPSEPRGGARDFFCIQFGASEATAVEWTFTSQNLEHRHCPASPDSAGAGSGRFSCLGQSQSPDFMSFDRQTPGRTPKFLPAFPAASRR